LDKITVATAATAATATRAELEGFIAMEAILTPGHFEADHANSLTATARPCLDLKPHVLTISSH